MLKKILLIPNHNFIILMDRNLCNTLFGVRLLSGIFGKKTPERMWLCAGISPVRYALQTR